MRIVILNFESASVDIITVEEKVIKQATEQFFDEDEMPDLNDIVETYLTEIIGYSLGSIQFMYGEELSINYTKRR